MEIFFNIYIIGVVISFIMFLSIFESHPEDWSQMLGITERFNPYWISLIAFMMSVFWIVSLPLYILCRHKENKK